MGKHRPPPAPAAPARPFHDAFSKLAGRLPAPDPGSPPPAAAPSPPPSPAAAPAGPARAVVRLERKGRGGKEATVVEKLGLSQRDLEAWVGEARRALGCGGAAEGEALVLQGDQRDRAVRWLEGKGVRKVVRG